MKNIEDYGFDRSDLIIATAVNSYLKNLTPEAKRETLAGIVSQNGAQTKINSERLTALIESAKAMAMIGTQGWKDGGDPLMKRTLEFIREQLPAVNGEEYIKKQPEKFLRFIEDWAKQ
jgi:hypothetical protein